MSPRTVAEFRSEREALNQMVLAGASLEVKRFLSLDSQAYRAGALPERTKEMLGLVASLVLRCDDCVLYHLDRCCQLGVSDDELWDVLGVGLVVGGSIVIPLLRRALRALAELRTQPPAMAADGDQEAGE